MMVRRDAFKRIGGFDPDFFAYFEDTDFCWRTWLYGFKVVYVPIEKNLQASRAVSTKTGKFQI